MQARRDQHVHERLTLGRHAGVIEGASQLVARLQAFGFTSRGATRYFLIGTGGLDEQSVAAAMQSGNWLITRGDSAIDRPC